MTDSGCWPRPIETFRDPPVDRPNTRTDRQCYRSDLCLRTAAASAQPHRLNETTKIKQTLLTLKK